MSMSCLSVYVQVNAGTEEEKEGIPWVPSWL